MPNRAPDRLAQAVRDLEQARSSAASERHEWALQASGATSTSSRFSAIPASGSIARALSWRTEALPLAAELLVYTEAEWALLREGSRLAQTIERQAMWLFERSK